MSAIDYYEVTPGFWAPARPESGADWIAGHDRLMRLVELVLVLFL